MGSGALAYASRTFLWMKVFFARRGFNCFVYFQPFRLFESPFSCWLAFCNVNMQKPLRSCARAGFSCGFKTGLPCVQNNDIPAPAAPLLGKARKIKIYKRLFPVGLLQNKSPLGANFKAFSAGVARGFVYLRQPEPFLGERVFRTEIYGQAHVVLRA